MQRDNNLTAHLTSRLFPRENNATVVLTVSRAEKVHYDSYVTVRVGNSSTPPVLSDSARGVAPFVDAVVRHRVWVNTRRGKGYVTVGIHMADGLGTPLGSTRLDIIPFVMDGERRSNGWPIRVRVGDDAVIVGFIKCIVDATERHGSNYSNRTGQPTTQPGDEETTDNNKWFIRRTKSLYHKSTTAERRTQPDRASKSLGNWTISSPIQFGKNIDRQRSRGDGEGQPQEHSQEEHAVEDSSSIRTWRSMSLSWASSTKDDATGEGEDDDNTKNRAVKIRSRLFGIRLGRRRDGSPESDTEHTNDSVNVSMSDIESDSEQLQQQDAGLKATDTAEAEVAELKRENKQLRRAAAQKRAAIKAENAWLRRRAAVLREAVFREPVAATVAHDLVLAREQMAVVQAERDLLALQAQLALGGEVNIN